MRTFICCLLQITPLFKMEICSENSSSERADFRYEPSYDRFLISSKTFNQQFCHLYLRRIESLRPILQESALEKWGPSIRIAQRIIDISENEQVIIIGTIYKEMTKKPSVLSEIENSSNISDILTMNTHENITSDTDYLVLEDETGRILLKSTVEIVGSLCVGLCIAVLGTMTDSGDFLVQSICNPGMAPLYSSPSSSSSSSSPKFLLLASGFSISSNSSNSHLLSLQMLVDFVKDVFPGSFGISQSDIARLVIIGPFTAPLTSIQLNTQLGPASKKGDVDSITQPLAQFDLLLAQLLSTIKTDIVPCDTDFTNLTIPHQPLHPCLLPQSSRYSTLKSVTCPYEFILDDKLIMVSSSQVIASIASCTRPSIDPSDVNSTRTLGIMEQLLQYRHLCPTCPDLIPSYPFVFSDPFVMTNRPHLFCLPSPNEQFGHVMVDGTRVCTVPSFAKTGSVLLINMNDLAITPISFSA